MLSRNGTSVIDDVIASYLEEVDAGHSPDSEAWLDPLPASHRRAAGVLRRAG